MSDAPARTLWTEPGTAHPDGCPCAHGDGASYCNCGLAAAQEHGATLGGLQAEVDRLRAGISWVRGMCSDGESLEAIDAKLAEVLS